VSLRETEIFRPSKAGAIVGSVHRGPCADKQRVKGRTAPPVPTTLVVPLIRISFLERYAAGRNMGERFRVTAAV
jgi:hypothetical protein